MPKKSVKQPVRKVVALQANNYLGRIEGEIKSNQSKVSMILGALIILVIGILIFNYFSKPKPALGPAQETQQTTQEDIAPNQLPGKYTVKEGDTLFLIAEKYYKDGYEYTEIVKNNNLANADAIEVGQVLEIPKLEVAVAEASPSPSPQNIVPAGEKGAEVGTGTGGGNITVWGPKIEGDTYTVVSGDWLSTIAARAYGDIYAYDKIAKANNIQNPDLIEPGQVLKLPR